MEQVTQDAGLKKIVHVPPGEGEAIWAAGDTYVFKAESGNTGGALLLTESFVPPGGGPPLHIHHRTDEAFYVFEGEIQFSEGDETFVAKAGSFVFAPRGVAHAFRNVGTKPAKMIAMAIPAGTEGLVKAIGQPAGEGVAPPPTQEQIEKAIVLAPQYDTEIVIPSSNKP